MKEYDRTGGPGRSFAQSHGIFYQPAFVLYDGSGELVYAGAGPVDPEDLESWIWEKLSLSAQS